MGEIKIKKILTFTSEDETYKAENLVSHKGKWTSAKNTNESKQSVTILLEKPVKIHQIDIENEFSAFIEVVVGSEKAKSDDDFKTLLPATSLMTPTESKNKSNGNRLKIFTNETLLNKDLAEQEFSVVKIFCTQPFNKEIQFGIGSVKFFEKVLNDDIKEAAKLQTGVFGLKKELSEAKAKEDPPKFIKNLSAKKESDEDEIMEEKKESIYDKWKKTKNTNSTTGNAKVKGSEDEDKNPKTSSSQNNKKTEQRSNDRGGKNINGAILRGVIFALSGFQNPLRAEIRDKGLKLGAKYRPDWTDDCTHLVTAFSNTPKVKEVKKSGKGKIVTKDWIFESEKQGKLLNADEYEIESDSDSSGDDKPRRAAKVAVAKIAKLKKKDSLLDSDEEEEEAENSDDRDFIVGSSDEEEDIEISESESEASTPGSGSSDAGGRSKKAKKRAKSTKKTKKAKKTKKEEKSSSSSSSEESEDDLEKYKKRKEKELREKKKKAAEETDKKEALNKKNADSGKKKTISYANDSNKDNKENKVSKKSDMKKSSSTASNKTIENSDMEENDNDDDWKLPSFFDEKKFLITSDYDSNKRKMLSRVVVAYGGDISDYMSDEVEFVITDKKWNKDFDEGLKENKKLKFVESAWLIACNRRKKLVPYQPFEIVPDVKRKIF